MLFALVSFWPSGPCGLIDLQLPRALCLVETWRTQGATLHHTGAWTREKVLARKVPSLMWWGSELSLLTVHGPRCRPHSEIWKGGGFPHWYRTSIFLSSSLSSPIWLPGSTLDPHPQDQESPVLEEFRTRRVSQRHSNSLGLSKHFLGVSQPWEETLVLCSFYSWICWASDHCVICPGSLCRSVGELGFEPRL